MSNWKLESSNMKMRFVLVLSFLITVCTPPVELAISQNLTDEQMIYNLDQISLDSNDVTTFELDSRNHSLLFISTTKTELYLVNPANESAQLLVDMSSNGFSGPIDDFLQSEPDEIIFLVSNEHVICSLNLIDSTWGTLAGMKASVGHVDGSFPDSRFEKPKSIVKYDDTSFFILDSTPSIRLLNLTSKQVTTIPGIEWSKMLTEPNFILTDMRSTVSDLQLLIVEFTTITKISIAATYQQQLGNVSMTASQTEWLVGNDQTKFKDGHFNVAEFKALDDVLFISPDIAFMSDDHSMRYINFTNSTINSISCGNPPASCVFTRMYDLLLREREVLFAYDKSISSFDISNWDLQPWPSVDDELETSSTDDVGADTCNQNQHGMEDNLYKCGVPGCDIGSAKKTVECTSMFRCTLRCERDAGCIGILYDAVNKICWLHSHATYVTPADANCCFQTC